MSTVSKFQMRAKNSKNIKTEEKLLKKCFTQIHPNGKNQRRPQ